MRLAPVWPGQACPRLERRGKLPPLPVAGLLGFFRLQLSKHRCCSSHPPVFPHAREPRWGWRLCSGARALPLALGLHLHQPPLFFPRTEASGCGCRSGTGITCTQRRWGWLSARGQPSRVPPQPCPRVFVPYAPAQSRSGSTEAMPSPPNPAAKCLSPTLPLFIILQHLLHNAPQHGKTADAPQTTALGAEEITPEVPNNSIPLISASIP